MSILRNESKSENVEEIYIGPVAGLLPEDSEQVQRLLAGRHQSAFLEMIDTIQTLMEDDE